MLTVPVIETHRLILRGHRPADLPECAAMGADPQVFRYIGGKPVTEQQAWIRLLASIGHWSQMGFGYWAVEDKKTGQFLGEVGFADFKREIEPSLKGKPEAGWVFASHAHGRGYATEAVLAALEWAATRFGAAETVCIIHPEHRTSLRVAEKCGFRELQHTTYQGEPTVLLGRNLGPL